MFFFRYGFCLPQHMISIHWLLLTIIETSQFWTENKVADKKKCSAPNMRNACWSIAVQPRAVSSPLQNHRHLRIVSFHAGLYINFLPRPYFTDNCPPPGIQRQQQLGNKLLNPHEVQWKLITVEQEATWMRRISSRQSRLFVPPEKRASGNVNRGHQECVWR